MTVAPKKSRTLRASTLMLAAGLALPLLAQAAEDPAVAQLTQRLMAMQANPDASQLAAFERLQAQQAVADLAKAKRRDLDQARYLAERRERSPKPACAPRWPSARWTSWNVPAASC